MKIPPQNIEAEMSILGGIFMDNPAINKTKEKIDADDFYKEAHRRIYRAMLLLSAKKEPVDFVTMCEQLKRDGDLEMVGGGAYLATLVDFVPTSANIVHYCKIVKERALARWIIKIAGDLTTQAYSDNLNIETLLSDARDTILTAGNSVHETALSDLLTLEERAERYVRYVNTLEKRRFLTGMPTLDEAIRGVAPGEVLTILAYSGTFKSAFMQNLLLNNARKTQRHQVFFSMEMPHEKCFEREAQIQAGVAGGEVESRFRMRNAEDLYSSMLQRGSQYLLVCDKSRLTLEKIGSYVDMARNKFGEIGAVGIDYLGLINAPGKSVFDKVSHISAEAKNLAKELRVPLIMLCQVNRGYAASKKVEIEMDAAKGGGDIEAGADFMLGFWLDGETLMAKLLKNRNGAANIKWSVEINKNTLQFEKFSPVEDRPVTKKFAEPDGRF